MPARCDAKLLPEGVRATGYRVEGAVISVDAEMIRSEAFCPGCGLRSARRHGRYVRSLADLPVHGRTVQLRLSVRRFRCLIAQCPVKTFGEAVPVSLAQPHGRRTGRFQDLVAYLGRAMGGRPAQALGRRILLRVSKDTFLRGAVRPANAPFPRPRVVGLDDWAWRKGQRYGTPVRDPKRRAVIDLLPDREPATVAAWLRRHPQIEIVARDRNGGYGRAISQALPDAIQVADRWHLLQNASDALLSAVRRAMSQIRKVAYHAELDPGILTAAERLQYQGFQRRQPTNALIQRMGREGVPIKRILRITGLSRGLVRCVLRGEGEDVFRLRQNSLTPWFRHISPQPYADGGELYGCEEVAVSLVVSREECVFGSVWGGYWPGHRVRRTYRAAGRGRSPGRRAGSGPRRWTRPYRPPSVRHAPGLRSGSGGSGGRGHRPQRGSSRSAHRARAPCNGIAPLFRAVRPMLVKPDRGRVDHLDFPVISL